MKQLRYTSLSLLAMIAAFVSCTSDSENETNGLSENQLVNVGYRVSAASGTSPVTRATNWEDANATDDEMMNVWTVVVVDASTNEVKYIRASKPTGNKTTKPNDNKEVDDMLSLQVGDYYFYSFANMAPSVVVKNLTGKDLDYTNTTEVTRDGNDPVGGNNNQSEIEWTTNPTSGDLFMEVGSNDYVSDKVYNIPVPDGATVSLDDVKKMSIAVNGNNFDPTSDNGFGATGIPMTNVQKKKIVLSTVFDVILVRTMAKIELRFYNETNTDLEVMGVQLSEITDNPSSGSNIMLLPNYNNSTGIPAQADEMAATHGNLKPNLSGNAGKSASSFNALSTGAGVTVPKNTPHTGTAYQTFTFYINESRSSVSTGNPGGLFYLTLMMGQKQESFTIFKEYRYAMISQKGSTFDDDNMWDYIARNDYRVIPIVLDDYKIELTPYDFPEIGAYPASVLTIDASKYLYQIDFHDYGHFHLLPKVTHNAGTETIEFIGDAPAAPYGATAWGLINNYDAISDWKESFSSYTDETQEVEYTPSYNKTNATGSETRKFYGKPGASGLPADNIYPNELPEYGVVQDASENGDWPLLDVNTNWSPTGAAPYLPYIFGQIAPQEFGADKKVFHELKVNLYVKGSSVPRVLTYRFYMHLIQDHPTARRRAAMCR